MKKYIQNSSISLPFTRDALHEVISYGIKIEPKYSHEEVARWCSMYYQNNIETAANNDVSLKVAKDVDAQWELYLVNTYSLQDLQEIDLSQVKLPERWFSRWLEMLCA